MVVGLLTLMPIEDTLELLQTTPHDNVGLIFALRKEHLSHVVLVWLVQLSVYFVLLGWDYCIAFRLGRLSIKSKLGSDGIDNSFLPFGTRLTGVCFILLVAIMIPAFKVASYFNLRNLDEKVYILQIQSEPNWDVNR